MKMQTVQRYNRNGLTMLIHLVQKIVTFFSTRFTLKSVILKSHYSYS